MIKFEGTTIDEYLEALPAECRAVLEHVRAVIRKAAPNAAECISYQIPTFKYAGKNLIHFAAFEKHYSLFPGAIVEQFAEDLKGFKTSKGTIRFTEDNMLPDALITRIVIAAIERNKAKATAKKKK